MLATNITPRVRDWDVTASRTDDRDRLVLTASPAATGEAVLCPSCGSGDVSSKGPTVGHLIDQPRAGRPVVMEVVRDRWHCGACRHGFSTPMPGAIAGGRMTRDGYGYALEQAAVVPIETLAETMGTAVSTLRRFVGDIVRPPSLDDGAEDGLADELTVCPLCIRRYERSMAVVRSVPLGALPGRFQSRLSICPTCDEEGAPMALCG